MIIGRRKHLPREIEEYLFKLDGIADVQVVGVPTASTARRWRLRQAQQGAFVTEERRQGLLPGPHQPL